MKHALVIKTDMLLKKEVLDYYQKLFSEQLKTGCVVIPAYFKAELLNVPTDAEVIIESASEEGLLNKIFNSKETNNG